MQIVLIIAYPLLTHLAIILKNPKLQACAIFILATGLLYTSLKAGHKVAWLILISISLLALTSGWPQLTFYALYVAPVLIPLLFLAVFGHTLLPGHTPLVTAIGEQSRGPLTEAMKVYTRKVTIMWTLVFLSMIISSVLLLWLASPELWSLFTNLLNYLFAGTVFIGEYLFRRYRFKDHDHPSFIDYLCIVARANIRKFDMPGTSIPLIKHYTPNAAMIYCPQRGKTETNKTLRATLTPSSQKGIINQATFLSAAMALAEKLPDHSHAINLCQDRSLFLLSFTAVLLRSMTNLLPPNRQQQTVIDIASDYHDCFVIADSAQDYQQLSIFRIDTLNCYHQTTDVTIPKPPLIEAEHIAAITFTSGSTGKPSANKKLWRTLVGTAARLAKRFLDKDTSPTIVATVPPQHMYGLEMTIMMALQGRCSMATGQPFYPQDIATTLTAIPQPRFLITTPAHLRAIQGAAIDMPQVHCIISSTAPLAETLAADSENLFQAQVKEIYGCTEAGSAATRRTNATDEWLLLDGMQLNQHGDNIEISGPHLSTSIELQDHLEILPDNRFRFLGRANDILNVAGKRASLADINQKLLDIDGVEDSVIFVPKCVNNKASRPAALVVSALSKRAILAALSQQIDPIFLPRPLRKVSHLPRNETGKLQHGILEQLLLQEQQGANTNE